MRIDLNSDLGESFGVWRTGDDEAIVQVVSSANVACGFHAGDPSTIRATCAAAAAAGVGVGAHVAYRDLAGFGRRFMDVHPRELTDDVVYQIGALQGLAAVAGTTVGHVKPHGALYNAITHQTAQARAVVAAVLEVDPTLPLLAQAGTVVDEEARRAGLRVVHEAFADRACTPEGRLVPRTVPGAVLHDPDAVAARAVRIATERSVVALDGTTVPLDVESICVHGDGPGAVAAATAVRAALDAAGVQVASFR